MTKPDQSAFHWQDVPAAIGLLTRIPVPVDADRAQMRGAAAAWSYPIVGLAVGCILAALVAILSTIGIPAPVTAALALSTAIIITGGMHEDGLSDSADGLWGGWEKARRLEIMKDSRIGAYGVLALILSVGLRGICLALLIASPLWLIALLVPATVSRAALVVVMHILPNARDTGLSHAVGRPSGKAAGVAIGLAALCALLVAGGLAISLCLIATLATLACIAIARRKIGGQTGDILGATQQVTEIAMLVTLTAYIS